MGVTLCLSMYHLLTVGVVVNVWVNLQLTMQLVPFTTSCEVESCSWRGVLDTTLCDKVCQRLATRFNNSIKEKEQRLVGSESG